MIFRPAATSDGWIEERQPMSDRDVTNDVQPADNPDGPILPLARCVCGAVFKRWQLTISIYNDAAEPMPCCGRRLYFQNRLRVFEIQS